MIAGNPSLNGMAPVAEIKATMGELAHDDYHLNAGFYSEKVTKETDESLDENSKGKGKT